METIKIIIANKCKINITPSAVVFTTRAAKSKVFTLPHSHIVGRNNSEIPYNDVHKEPAVEYEITMWIFSRVKEDLESMRDHDCIIPKH